MKRFLSTIVLAALVAGGVCGRPAVAAFVVPDSVTVPFTDWSRTDADSMYAEWNVFTSATNPNNPDVGAFGPSVATVDEGGAAGAFLTGGGNIYSFSGATDFDVTIPNYGYGTGYNTRVVLQLATLGSPVDVNSVLLTFNDGSGAETVPFDAYSVVTAGAGMGASAEWLFAWDLASFNPASMLVEFKAASSSMSLDKVAVDTFTQTSAFGAIAVPEPASAVLVGVSLLGLAVRRRRVG